MEDTIAAAKQALRERLLAARRERSPSAMAVAGSALASTALQHFGTAAVVAAFASIPGEPPTSELRLVLRSAGITVLLPVIVGTSLDWAVDDGVVEPGPLAISEPIGPRLGPLALGDADVVLVPALAADRDGHRLGRGRGYYDRALASLSGPRLVAIVFDDELIDQVPVEPHDVAVDAVLTPSGLTVVGAV